MKACPYSPQQVMLAHRSMPTFRVAVAENDENDGDLNANPAGLDVPSHSEPTQSAGPAEHGDSGQPLSLS